MFDQFKRRKHMNRIFKTISVMILIALVTVLFGTHMVRALRNWAAPPPLPYGLTMQEGWELGLPTEGGTPDHIYYRALRGSLG
jgi:hypothetical protein